MYTFDDLNDDALSEILSYLSINDLVSMIRLNNRKVFKIAGSPWLWMRRFEQYFPFLLDEVKRNEDIKEINWHNEFARAYKCEDKTIPQEKLKIFTYVKENNIAELTLQDLDELDKCGRSLLDWALKQHHQPTLNHIYQLAVENYSKGSLLDTTMKDNFGRTILHWAALCNQPVSHVEWLITQGAEVDEKIYESGGITPLLIATRYGHYDIVNILLRHNASIDCKHDFYPISSGYCYKINTDECVDAINGIYVRYQYVQYQEELESDDQDINYHNGYFNFNISNRNYTPLHIAASRGDLKMVNLLLEYNALINATTTWGTTSLHLAVQHGNVQVINQLLEKRADINIEDGMGWRAISLAVKGGNDAVFDALFARQNLDLCIYGDPEECSLYSYGYVYNRLSMLFFAIQRMHRYIAYQLLKKNIDVITENQNQEREILYYHAIKWGDFDTFNDLLVNVEIDVNQAIFGFTPLMLAVRERRPPAFVVELIRRGAEISKTKKYTDETLLHIAVRNRDIRMVKYLIAHPDIDVEAKNSSMQTPLNLAVQNGNDEIVKILKEANWETLANGTAGFFANNNIDKNKNRKRKRGNLEEDDDCQEKPHNDKRHRF